MRLIGSFDTEKEAYHFYSFLLKEGIQNIYEPYTEEKTGAKQYRVWVYDEDDLDTALDWLKRYREHPGDPAFQGLDPTIAAAPPSPAYAEVSESEEQKWQSIPPPQIKVRRFSMALTYLIIIFCSILFFWNDAQEGTIRQEKGSLAAEIAMTPLEKQLLFDDPSSYRYIQEIVDTVPLNNLKEMKELPPEALALLKQADETPSWRGLYSFFAVVKKQGWQAAESIPMFEKIRQGEAWRLFTPCVMHANFLHILFNMIWVWLLCKQIEERVNKFKICLLILIIGVVSNVAQYLVSGPFFLGFSGIVVGMAGFIWMRQKRAPWEGYPLQKGTIVFLLFFVLAMLAIDLFSFSLQMLTSVQLSPNIANTAHIVGGLVGILLGRFSFFGRRMA